MIGRIIYPSKYPRFLLRSFVSSSARVGMRDHHGNCSTDAYEHLLGTKYDDFDYSLHDITEESLVKIGIAEEKENLSPCTFPSPAFPVNGVIHGVNNRSMVPLVCQHFGKESKPIVVWFLVHTGSCFTTLTKKSLEAILGPGNANNSYYKIALQDQKYSITCRPSKGGFEFANVLGSDALSRLQLSVSYNWETLTFQLLRQ